MGPNERLSYDNLSRIAMHAYCDDGAFERIHLAYGRPNCKNCFDMKMVNH